MGGLFAGTLVTLFALRAIESYLMSVTGQRVMHDLREALFRHLLTMEARFFDRQAVGRLMTRVLNDVDAVSEAFTSGLFAVVADAVTLLGVVAIMLWMDWRLALVTFAIVPAVAVVAAYFRLRARDAYRTVRRRLAQLNAFLQESLAGMAVIQLFAREGAERRQFRALNRRYRRALFGSTVFDSSLYASVEALGFVALALLLWYGGRQIAAEALTLGSLVAFMQYTSRFFLPIRDLGAKYTVMQAAMISAERIFGVLDLTPGHPVARIAPEGRPARGGGRGGAPRRLVRIPRGPVGPEGVFVPGPARRARGAGGRDGRGQDDVRTAPHAHLRRVQGTRARRRRRRAGLGPRAAAPARGRGLPGQRPLHGVGRGQPARGRRRRRCRTTLLVRAAEAAGARAFIEALPHGWRTELSERGANISHGERQLVAMARALVYNPAVLVLDEATSSIDPESEALIQAAMSRLLAGRTSITIAHRLSTIQRADRILVLHHGHIHEEGTHEALLRRGGLYARVCELQFGAESARA